MITTRHILIGTGTLTLALIIYNYYQRRRQTPNVFYVTTLLGNFNARTLPPFGIFIAEAHKKNTDLYQHEKMHWEQYQQKGLFTFYRDYYTQHKKYGYNKMPMEIEARTNESEYCKTNYTECVQIGQAKTVFNPQFRS